MDADENIREQLQTAYELQQSGAARIHQGTAADYIQAAAKKRCRRVRRFPSPDCYPTAIFVVPLNEVFVCVYEAAMVKRHSFPMLL